VVRRAGIIAIKKTREVHLERPLQVGVAFLDLANSDGTVIVTQPASIGVRWRYCSRTRLEVLLTFDATNLQNPIIP
jgi:hypothetical protein